MELFLQQVVNGLVIGSTYTVVALGFSLIFSVMGVVNMAHPEIFMISMFVGLLIAAHVASNFVVVVIGVMLVSGLTGMALERVVLRPLRSPNLLVPLIGTIGVAIMIQYTTAGIFGPDPRPFPRLIAQQRVTVGGVDVTTLQLTNFVLSLLIMIGVSYYVRRTRWGRATRAVAERYDVAAAFGVDVNRVAQVTVVLASMMAGVAGVSIALLYGSAWAFVGGLYALKSFVCMLVAGNKHIEGVMAVGLTLGVIEALMTGFVSSSLRDAVAFVILIAVLYFRPLGLFGSYRA